MAVRRALIWGEALIRGGGAYSGGRRLGKKWPLGGCLFGGRRLFEGEALIWENTVCILTSYIHLAVNRKNKVVHLHGCEVLIIAK